ncbi:MAG: hypothetical protein BGO43_09400 [Gammaproteobacteria bacterium 39-13]|nr:hypothetical protein [Gammaproteobacteria bacterium]OJV93857.1 MAG: hypothetical protein BGO43_09400 [Gammaproteobacteria bacterium 39-13]
MPQAPFFSAVVEKNVVYEPAGKGGISKLFSSFSDLLNSNQVLKLSTYLALIAGNIGITTSFPLSVALPVNLLSTYLGYQHIKQIRAAERKAHFLNATKHIQPPTALAHPTQKNRKITTFNHVFSFVKANSLWWYALRDNEHKAPEWKKLYIDKLPLTEIEDSEIIADGQNVMIKVQRDNYQEIFYKKVIAEKRVNDKYVVTNLCEELEAKDTWFTLPVASFFKPKQYHQRLKLPFNAEWAMSHSGDYKAKVVDSRGIVHPNLGVTTVFEFNLPVIRLHDPFVERNSEYEIRLPENVVPYSEFEASASYLFFIGQEIGDPEDQFSLFFRYLDYDSQGLNPAIGFTHDVKDIKRRLLPFPGWQKQELPQGISPDVTISAIQCGNKKHTVEIRLHSQDEASFFYKTLDDTAWQKSKTNDEHLRDEFKSEVTALSHSNTYSTQQVFTLNGKKITQADCHSFDLLTDFCPVVLTQQGGSNIHLQLYRYKNMLAAFVGLTSESWSFRADPRFPVEASILGKKQYLPVSVKSQAKTLTIDSLDASHPFHLNFERKTKQPIIPAKQLSLEKTPALRQEPKDPSYKDYKLPVWRKG